MKDLGLYRLASPERVFQVNDGTTALRDFPPFRAVPCHASALPLQLTRFFGREREIALLRGLVLGGEARLVTLTGPGGTGKTRLAIEAAGQLLEAFQGAVWFVPLADVSDARLIAGALLEAMGVEHAPGAQPLEVAAAALSARASLLVLDNFEQVAADGSGVVRTLLSVRRT